MKKTITLIVLLIINCSLIIVNAQSTYFNKRIDITNGDWDLSTSLVTQNNSYLIVGDNGPGRHIYLSKIDSIGNIEWTKMYDSLNYTYYMGLSGALFKTTDKYYAFCGDRVLPWPGPGWGTLIKVDSTGNKIWEKEYQILNTIELFSGNITNNGGYILTGRAYGGGKSMYLLINADSLGNQQWYQTYTDNHPMRNYFGSSVIQTPDNGYCIGGGGGYWYLPGSEYRGIAEIIKTDSLGNQQWKKSYGNPLLMNGGCMIGLSKDSCIIVAYSNSIKFITVFEDYTQPYLEKRGLDSILKWCRKIANVQSRNGTTWIQTLENGDFILSGCHRTHDTSNNTFYRNIGWLYKIKSNSDSIWYREYTYLTGSNDNQELRQVTQTPDNGFVATGSLYPDTGNGSQDIWLFKTDSVGCLVPGCDVGITEFNPNAGVQMLIYPNPFTNAFTINYNIPAGSKKAVFILYDIYGKLVYHVGLNTSINQLQVVANKLESGVYLASLVIDGIIVKTDKIMKN